LYIAHKREDGKEQSLLEHLNNTAQRAAYYASFFCKDKLAYICGLLHDIGKYSDEFQNRIKNNGELCDHSTAGAKLLTNLNKPIGYFLGYVITGHHSGLLNGGGWGATSYDKCLYGRLKKEIPKYSSYEDEIEIKGLIDIIKIAQQISYTKPLNDYDMGYCLSFLIRIIYSCLVDADFLDTEEFMNDGKVDRGVKCNFVNLEEKIIKHANSFIADSYIKEKRKQIFNCCLESNIPVRKQELTDEEKVFLADVFLLTSKPVIYVANIPEESLPDGRGNNYFSELREHTRQEDSGLIAICASVEEELSQLDISDRLDFLNELQLESPGLVKLIEASYSLLGLISFLTANQEEARAWPVLKGTPAHKAAGKIHSDFERGFIRAEVIPFSVLESCGSYTAAKEKGLIRSEGKDYMVQDGDVILFRFNV
jgi:CRISPR-associated endonuclease Cas3-HD